MLHRVEPPVSQRRLRPPGPGPSIWTADPTPMVRVPDIVPPPNGRYSVERAAPPTVGALVKSPSVAQSLRQRVPGAPRSYVVFADGNECGCRTPWLLAATTRG